MKILLVDGEPELGGAQRSLLELAQALAVRGGVALCAAVPDGRLAAALGAAGVPVAPLPVLRLHAQWSGRTWREGVALWRAARHVARRVRDDRPDLVHANGTAAAVAAVLGCAGRVPVLWHLRDLPVRRWLVRGLTRRVAAVLAISEAVAARALALVPPAQRGKIWLIRNGVDTARFHPGGRAEARQRFQLPTDGPLVGMVAHLVPWKRHDLFLTAAAAVRRMRPDVQFLIAGRDLCRNHPRLREALEAQATAAGLAGALHWVEPGDDLAGLLPALDLLVHPAAQEPFGRVVCEAMSVGIPVVAARQAGPAALVPDGEGGVLVPPEDAAAFVAPILSLLADPAAACSMGARGRKHVVAHFDVARVATELLAVYRELLRG
jgi:glycosyltransferase involved in cell wall biosynthesis